MPRPCQDRGRTVGGGADLREPGAAQREDRMLHRDEVQRLRAKIRESRHAEGANRREGRSAAGPSGQPSHYVNIIRTPLHLTCVLHE